MPRSSLRHNREIQGYDSAGETPDQHGEIGNLPQGLKVRAVALSPTGIEVTFSQCVSVGALTGIEYQINGGSWVQVTGETKMTDTVYRFVVSGISLGDTVLWRYVGGSGSIVDCNAAADVGDLQAPVTVPAVLAIDVDAPAPEGIEGQAYSHTVSSTGGWPPVGIDITSGKLPSGLSHVNGVISGTVTNAPENEAATWTATDAQSNTDADSLAIQTWDVLQITTTTLPNGYIGSAYSQQLQATGGKAPYSWLIVSGSLPAGLSMSMTGLITGTPTTEQTANFTVRAVDADSLQTDTQALSIEVVSEALPVFHAITPDAATYEMQGVLTGTGDLTEARASDLLLLDKDGIYRTFGASEPGYEGGRVVRNIQTYSDDPVTASAANPGWTRLNAGTGLPPAKSGDWVVFDPGAGGGAGDYSLLQSLIDVVTPGNTFRLSIDLEAQNACEVGILEFGEIKATTYYPLSAGERKRFSFIGVFTSNNNRIIITGDRNAGAVALKIKWQFEPVDGQSNQNPGEHVTTTTTALAKTFANQNGNTVSGNVVTEAVGAPLAEVPWLVHAPAATNDCPWSRSEFSSSGVTKVADLLGIDGTNGARSYQATTTINARVQLYGNAVNLTSQICSVVMWIKKNPGNTNDIWILINSADFNIRFNADTGIFSAPGTGVNRYEAISEGDWWKIVIESNAISATNNELFIYPSDGAVENAVTFDGVSLYKDTTLEVAKSLPPIFTAGAAVTRDVCALSFNVANHSDDQGAYYVEVTNLLPDQGAATVYGNIWTTRNSVNAGDFGYRGPINRLASFDCTTDWSTTIALALPFSDRKVGLVYSAAEGKRSAYLDGATEEESTYTSPWCSTLLNILRNNPDIGVAKIRDFRRYDVDYDTGKTIIDGLMS